MFKRYYAQIYMIIHALDCAGGGRKAKRWRLAGLSYAPH
jgi:hypothetical protein